MSKTSPESWILLRPPFTTKQRSAALFVALASAFVKIQRRPLSDDGRGCALTEALDATLVDIERAAINDRAMLTAAARVLYDLARQRWRVRVRGRDIEVCPPREVRADPRAEKERVRRQELLKRDEQLDQPAVARFVREMERQRLHGGRFVSIFSLMRDGRELAAALRTARELSRSRRGHALREVIDPYLSFATEDARCEFTGLRLQEIWRYFRHTWSNQYTSTPGRSMAVLVRDRAAPMHPVIGIAALGSPVVQIKERDTWIGWHPAAFFENASEAPSPRLGEWLRRIVTTAIEEIYTDDLIAEEVIDLTELRNPIPSTLAHLNEYASEQRKLHHRYVRSREHKGNGAAHRGQETTGHWVAKARTHLFRSKRALALAEMLRARLAIDRQLGPTPARADVAALLADREGKKAALKILRKAKADRVGIAMADITVCGAVPPYSGILGGKLVAMLAASPEMVEAYRERYQNAESEIASSIAARPIVRPAQLVFLGTSSLYGVCSSQYNRVRVPAERLGGRVGDEIRYREIGRSDAFGTSQYGSATVEALVKLVHHSNGGQRVNSIFGEGVSPKLRKVREGLEVLQFPTEHLLRHGRRRIVYGVTLVRNTREFLMGLEDSPDYLFSEKGAEATAAISEWWRERWLSRRIDQDLVLDEVGAHTLVRPVRHGARVPLPVEAADHADQALVHDEPTRADEDTKRTGRDTARDGKGRPRSTKPRRSRSTPPM